MSGAHVARVDTAEVQIHTPSMKCVSVVVLFALAACGDDTTTPADAGLADVAMQVDTAAPVDTGSEVPDTSPPDTSMPLDSAMSQDAAMMMLMGACTNAADEAALVSGDADMTVEDCAGPCFGGAECTANCVMMQLGVTAECAGCFGAVTMCSATMCPLQCLGDSPECEVCRNDMGCTAQFDTCAGTI